jgi:hypothetical protein
MAVFAVGGGSSSSTSLATIRVSAFAPKRPAAFWPVLHIMKNRRHPAAAAAAAGGTVMIVVIGRRTTTAAGSSTEVSS